MSDVHFLARLKRSGGRRGAVAPQRGLPGLEKPPGGDGRQADPTVHPRVLSGFVRPGAGRRGELVAKLFRHFRLLSVGSAHSGRDPCDEFFGRQQ